MKSPRVVRRSNDKSDDKEVRRPVSVVRMRSQPTAAVRRRESSTITARTLAGGIAKHTGAPVADTTVLSGFRTTLRASRCPFL